MSQDSKDHGNQAEPSRRGFLKMAAVAGGMLGFPRFSQAASSQPGSPGIIRTSSKSSRPSITFAGYPYDRVKGLVNGKVKVEGCDTQYERANIYKLNGMAMGGDQKWEFQEIGLHPYMLAYANTNFRDYTLIPVFPLRTFRHKSMFIRTDRGINTPEDLRGKTVAAAGYSQSSLVWIRGILQHEYGVKAEEMQWIISKKSSDKGNVSKNESALPVGVPITMGPEGMDESELLVSGKVDAVFSALEPQAYNDGHPKIARLFSDNRQIERKYFTKTGIFPIMHAVALRQDIVKKHPWLPEAVFHAYSQAKQQMYKAMKDLGWAMISLPWIGKELEDTQELMGENFWPYGIPPNRKTLEALFQYSYEQGLAKRKLPIEELFHPSTLHLIET
ncbi:MAG: twin-arginine translocation signal domain-containing protein [Nitrospirales bacterium]